MIKQNGTHTNQNWDNMIFRDVDFTGVDISGSNLSESLFIGCSFRGAVLHDVCLVDSVLLDCDFRGAQIATGDLAGARCWGCQFDPDIVTIESYQAIKG